MLNRVMTRILLTVVVGLVIGMPACDAAPMVLEDWHQDVPGRVHRIDPAALPPPYATASSANPPRVIPRPQNASLSVPPHFRVDLFASGLTGPRKLLAAPNGDIFVSETAAGRISVLHPNPDGTAAATIRTFAAGMTLPFGLAFYPDAARPRWLYVAETNRVIRFRLDGAEARGESGHPAAFDVVVPHLPAGGAHITRDIAFSRDGRRLFVSVGSASNVAESMPKKSTGAILSWESAHGLGAAWGAETDRADVLTFDVAGPTAPKTYATGLRNCVSLTRQPTTGALWCTTNERDQLGDDLVPDYSTRLEPGGFYGWPWYYFGAHADPRLAGDRPDLEGKALVPDVPYQAHSAALDMLFYTARPGSAAFPGDYAGDAFVALHGSWNRASRTGYKLVRVRMVHGEPTGEYEDFLTGFIIDDGTVWGRPVGLAELADGSLLFSDDAGDSVYRVAYEPPMGNAPAEPAGADLPPLSITGKALQKSIDVFVSKATDASLWSDDHPVARWNSAICPLVAGLSRQDGQQVFDEFTEVLAAAHIALGKVGCRPNFFILATTQPAAVLKGLWHRSVNRFGDSIAQAHKFIDTPRPIRLWYNAAPVDGDGSPPSPFGDGTGMDGVPTFIAHLPSQFKFVVVPDVVSVIAVIDLPRVIGFEWRQLADYIAMSGLTKMNPDADLGRVPTILRLFAAEPGARPREWSDWDRSFVEALYGTDASDKHQRVAVSRLMFRALSH
jgi:glucose/arabinose dehydrogenase